MIRDYFLEDISFLCTETDKSSCMKHLIREFEREIAKYFLTSTHLFNICIKWAWWLKYLFQSQPPQLRAEQTDVAYVSITSPFSSPDWFVTHLTVILFFHFTIAISVFSACMTSIACLSVLEERSLPFCSSWGFFLFSPLLKASL